MTERAKPTGDLKEALDLLASTEDALWRPELRDFLAKYGYVFVQSYLAVSKADDVDGSS